MKYTLVNLPNGGKLHYAKNILNKATMVDIGFDSGARNDTVPGLAHFTEHMFFSGTDKLSKDEVSKKYWDFINVNAFTGTQSIYFTGKVFTNEFEDYVKTVAMLITETTFSQEAVDKEKGIVQQEIARKKDNFKSKANLAHDYNCFKLPEFKHGILGSQESVAKITSKDVKEFVKKYFVSNNLDVFVVSPLPLGKVKKIIKTELSNKLPNIKGFERQPYFYMTLKDHSFYKLEHQDIGKNYIFINFLINHDLYEHKFKYQFRLVLDMINDFSSGMLKDLRLKKSLTYGADISTGYLIDKSFACFTTECDKQNVNEIFKTLAEYLRRVAQDGFTQEEFDKAKRQIKYSRITDEPRLSRIMNTLYHYKYWGKVLKQKDKIKILKNTTLEECNQMFREVFVNPKVSATVYGNITEKELMTKAEFKNLFKSKK